jgi:putative membrane protein
LTGRSRGSTRWCRRRALCFPYLGIPFAQRADRIARKGVAVIAAFAITSSSQADLPVPQTVWAGLPWSFEAWVLACLAVSAALYGAGLARLWRHAGWGRGVSGRRALIFSAGWLGLVLALVSPLDALGSRLFSAHMVQHEVLMTVCAPLLVLGRPLAVWAWAIPPSSRRALGRFFRSPGWRVPWRIISGALAAWVLHALAIWLWHVPAWFEAALADERIHALQHCAFLGSALLYWWSVAKATTRGAHGVALISIVTTMVHSGALGAVLTFAATAWYPSYAQTAQAFGLNALQDQQLGGLVMWVVAGLAYVCAGVFLVGDWLAEPTAAGVPARSMAASHR